MRPPSLVAMVMLTASVTGCVACGPASGGEPDWRARVAAERDSEPASRPSGTALREATIHEPPSLTTIASPVTDASGRTVGIACATCHAMPNVVPDGALSDDRVAGPHVGLTLRHGSNTCASCHLDRDPTQLQLAGGEAIPMRDAMRLCAQCHGSKHTDYVRGVHGGMRGYWDLSRGPRERNHCVDCHDPHAPAYPRFRPLPPPTDRYPPASPEGAHE